MILLFLGGGVVVVNCEAGLPMTGYDATTAKRRGQVGRLDFRSHKHFLSTMAMKTTSVIVSGKITIITTKILE